MLPFSHDLCLRSPKQRWCEHPMVKKHLLWGAPGLPQLQGWFCLIPGVLSSLWCLEKEKKQKGNESGLKGSAGGRVLPAAPPGAPPFAPRELPGLANRGKQGCLCPSVVCRKVGFCLNSMATFSYRCFVSLGSGAEHKRAHCGSVVLT